MGRVIAIDYGKKRIGIAMTDEHKSMALPFKTIQAGNTLEKSVSILLDILYPYLSKTEKIVIGLPLSISGKKNKMVLEVEKFKNMLQKKIDIPIELFDERLTSFQADEMLKEINLSRKKRCKTKDAIAANIILQDYLDTN